MNKNKKILALVVFVVAIIIVVFYFNYKTNENKNYDDSLWLNAYYHGDYKKTVELLKPLAADGNTNAMYNLGILYLNGLGVEKDTSIAINYFEKAASMDNVSALNGLGNMYSLGLGVGKNYKKAIMLFNKAIILSKEQKKTYILASVYFNLASIYLDKNYVNSDYAKGFNLLTKSAAGKNISAQTNLAAIYLNGLYGVAKDNRKAIGYLKEAVNAGDTVSQCNLGLAYKNGLGVKKDLGKAYKWFYIAAHYNYEKAIQNIEILNSQISAGDKETAVQEAKEWIKTHKEMNMELTTAGLIKSVNKKE